MLEKIFQTIMRRYFGQFLTGLQNVQLAFWTGKIHLTNISLKHQKINQLLKEKNIPFSIKYSYIGSLQIDVPWKSLSSTPVQIKIQKVYIVLKMQKITSVQKKIEQQKLSLIKNYIQHLIKKSVEAEKGGAGDSEAGYFQKMVVKIIHNLNADVKDISIRIVSEQGKNEPSLKGSLKQDDFSIKQSQKSKKQQIKIQQQDEEQFMSVSSGERQIKVSQMKTSRRPKNQKSFALGFCIQGFSLQTVDNNFKKTFYNSDSKKREVRKVISMKQISTYLQQQSIVNIFKIEQESKNQFLRNVILRQKYRLLTIDGRIIMNKNAQKQRFYDYFFATQLQNLQIKSTYGQIRQITKIITNFQTASGAKQIKKLKQLQQQKQQQLKQEFISQFPVVYAKKFAIQSIDAEFGDLLCSVSKKNLLSWTKECAIGIIKESRLDAVRKEKNKKGWINYIIAKAEVDLTEEEISQIYEEVEEMIKNIQYQKKLCIGLELVFQKIRLTLSHQQLQQCIYLQLQQTHLAYKNTQASQSQLCLTVKNIQLKYVNEKQSINSSLLSQVSSKSDQNIIQFHFERVDQDRRRKVKLKVSQIEICHQVRVLLLVNQILKLKANQQMKSDVLLKKAQIQSKGRNIQQQLGKNYIIDIHVDKIIFKIEVNDSSYVLISLDSIQVNTKQEQQQQTYHKGIINSLNISYNTHHKKSQLQNQHINRILKDFTINFVLSNYFDKINTKMATLQLFICESDLHNIYRSFLKQAQIFKTEKIQQKNKIIHQNAYLKGHLKLLNLMKTWKDYEGVLTDDGLYFFEQQIYDDEEKMTHVNQRYTHMIPINNCSVTIVNEQQFKIQSKGVNQLIQCSPQQLQQWVQYIQNIVFENSSKAKMYKLIDETDENTLWASRTLAKEDEKVMVKYKTQIVFQFERIEVLVCQNRQKNLMRLSCCGLIVTMSENQLNFQRSIILNEIYIRKLQQGNHTQFNYIVKNKKYDEILPIKIRVKGKKKLHPEYRGQLSIKVTVPYLKVNYDPEFIYKMIKKIAWGHEVPSYTNQMRNTKVLEMTKQFLRSSVYEKRQAQINSQSCKKLHNYQNYLQINKYKALGHTCLVLLSVKAQVDELELNLINGINNVCVFNAKSQNLKANINKGSQFLFFKLTALNLQLFDVTGYPYTNTKPNKIAGYYPLIQRKPQQQRISKQGVQCYVSLFEIDRFVNKDRLKTFFQLDIFDAQLNFQNQPINRFFDYLFNQIIGFILAPNSLHKYDGPKRGPYLYDHNTIMTQKQIKSVIMDALQPFFSKMYINAYNLTVRFNSFPKLQGFNLDFQSMKIQSYNYQKAQRIRLNTNQLNKIEKHPVFRELMGLRGFQEKLLRNQWVSRMDIVVQGIKSVIFTTEVPKIHTYMERLINGQKQIIFPFVTLDTSMIIQSQTNNLSISAPRQIYNLINKCMMHNLSYDDQQDFHFNHNSKFKNFMKISEMFYRLKAAQLQLVIPQMGTRVVLPQFSYKFIRHTNQLKIMEVQAKSLYIFKKSKNSEIIIMPNESKANSNINGLIFKIEMKTNGQKDMTVHLNNTDIYYDLDFFLKFVQYTILQQSCYPPLPANTIISQLPDLPLLKCLVVLESSRIKLQVPKSLQDDQFICSGNIVMLWIRNSLIHPQRYANNPQNYPNGKQWCSYKIQIKDMSIRKHYKQRASVLQTGEQKNSSYLTGPQRSRYRSISNNISLVFEISQIMKLANNQRDKYNDHVFKVKVSNLGMKLCYVDIQHLGKVFGNKDDSGQKLNGSENNGNNPVQSNVMQQSQIMEVSQLKQRHQLNYTSSAKNSDQRSMLKPPSQSPEPVPVPNLQQPKVLPYTPYTKYSVQIVKIKIQLGLSELPVPLIDVGIKSTKSTIQKIGEYTNISMKTSIVAHCWNMLIGRWEPIIQELSPSLNCKLGKDKYLLFDCSDKLLFNVSLEALKIVKLISSDFSLKGNFSVSQIFNKQRSQQQANSDSKIKGINVSPYVFTNLTGVSIYVHTSSQTKLKLKSGQKAYIQLKNYQLDFSQKTKVIFQFEQSSQQSSLQSQFEVNMDLAKNKKIAVKYKKRQHQLLLKPISNSIMKQIVLSSLFVFENRTNFQIIFYYNYGVDQEERDTYEGKISVMSKQKTALKFTANIKNSNMKSLSQKVSKHLKIDFPQLQKYEIENNCQFPYQAILNDYQHQIDMSKNRTFNCVISLNQELESQIIVQPSFYVKNLLPVDILIQFVVERNGQKVIITNQIGVNQQKDIYDFNSKQSLQVRLKVKGFNISPFQSIPTSPKTQQQTQTQLDLIDYRGHSGCISLKIAKANKVRKLYIYSQAVLINQTGYNWYAFSSSKLMPGQKIPDVPESDTIYTFIHASQYASLNFGFEDDAPFGSNQIKLGELGLNDVVMYKNQQQYQFTLKCNFHCLDNTALIYSYVLKAQPKHIIQNQTTTILQITQIGAENKSKALKPGQRLNWTWPERTHGKYIVMRPVMNEEGGGDWLYSEGIALEGEDVEEDVFVVRGLGGGRRIMKIIPIKQHQSNYFIIEQVNKLQDYLITINNQLQFCKIQLYQQCIPQKNPQWLAHKAFQSAPKSVIPLGWDYPNELPLLMAEVSFTGYLRTKFDVQSYTIDLRDPKVERIVIQNQDGETEEIVVKVEVIGLRKRVSFCKREEFGEEDPQLEMMHTGNRFAFSFTEIGVSIISSVKRRSQLLFLNLKKVQIIMMQKKSSRSLQVKIKYINIDNNHDHNTIYPILFTPLKHQKTMTKSRPFFVLLLEQTLQSKDIIQIKQFRVCNEPISIKIHDEILTAVFQMIQEMNKETDKSQGKIDLLGIYRAGFRDAEWKECKLIKPQRDIFFRQFQIAKLALQLTFSIRPKLNTNNFIIMTILSSFGAAISNVSEAQLMLSRFLKKDKGLSQLKAEISDFYFKQFIRGIYKVLGSINLFGNPYVFIKMFAEGAWQIINQPTQGFIKGPIQGAIGIAKGGIFFTRNIVAGTCNSFQAISQSISRGVSNLTMDQKFIERRQKIKIQKSNHLLKGLQYGAFSIYTGVEVAVTGLVRHPAQGYRKSGFVGGVTGTLKGIAGLVTKPISGTFGGISKISQGIKNTALLFQDGPNSKRIRPPRIFISQLSYYKNYNIYQSTAVAILQYASTKYLNERINYIAVTENNNLIDAYVMTQRFFSHVDILKGMLLQELEIKDIKEYEIEGHLLKLHTSRDFAVIQCENPHEIVEVFKSYAQGNNN